MLCCGAPLQLSAVRLTSITWQAVAFFTKDFISFQIGDIFGLLACQPFSEMLQVADGNICPLKVVVILSSKCIWLLLDDVWKNLFHVWQKVVCSMGHSKITWDYPMKKVWLTVSYSKWLRKSWNNWKPLNRSNCRQLKEQAVEKLSLEVWTIESVNSWKCQRLKMRWLEFQLLKWHMIKRQGTK